MIKILPSESIGFQADINPQHDYYLVCIPKLNATPVLFASVSNRRTGTTVANTLNAIGSNTYPRTVCVSKSSCYLMPSEVL